jgi:predicted ester cyclase
VTHEEILRVVQIWTRAVASCDAAALEQIVTPTVRDPVVARTQAVHVAFKEVDVVAQEVVVEGDVVAWRWRLSGVHVGAIGGIAPSGRRKTIEGANFQRLRDGIVIDHWTLVDLSPLSRP